MRFIILACFVFAFQSALTQTNDSVRAQSDSIPFLSFDSMSATEFFDFIRNHPYNEKKVLTVHGNCKAGWVKEDDVHYLIRFIRSTEKMPCLNHIISSFWPDKGSELGGYALDLIMSYRYNSKFFEGLYHCTVSNNSRADEYEQWYRETFPEKTNKK